MAGQVKALIDKIIQERSKGYEPIAISTETKIILKGINPKQWNDSSPDDPETIKKLKEMAREFGLKM